jgi:hypothetical protein
MKKLIPYILAYVIVATATAVYPHIYRHFATQAPYTYPHDSVAVVLNPGVSHDDLVAKLQQVGLSEAVPPHIVATIRPAPFYTLAYHYVFDAVIFAAFAGLTLLFQRAVCTNCKSHDVAA